MLLTCAATAGLAGFATMGLELTAVRLLAPHFGDSAYVWTNVIGVILLALALGAWFGGRLAERPAGSPLAGLLLGAAALAALAPLVARPLGGWLLPQDLPLDAAMPALVRGSLVATAVLFAPPIWLLGAIAPGLITRAVRAGAATGRAAGAVSAAGTLGSLLGTFAATHWLVPGMGCRATLWLCAVVLALAALLLRGRRAAALGVTALVGGSLLLHGGPLRLPPPGAELLAERETSYQYLQVLRWPGDGPQPARTELKINEGLDSFHSVAIEQSVFASGPAPVPSAYYDYHALAPLLAGDGARPPGLRALSLGDAAGTFRRIYAGVHPGAAVDAVELDPAAVALGDEFFAGRRAPGRIWTGLDGRVMVELSGSSWHVVHVDAYSHQVYVPAHLASRQFFAAVRDRLLPGGVVACNVGGLSPQDAVVGAIAGTMAAVFGQARGLHVPNSRNFLLVARRDQPLRPERLASFAIGGERLDGPDLELWRRLLDVADDPAAWHTWSAAPADRVLVDDRPELDRLLHGSYLQLGDDARPVAIAGDEAAEHAEAEAFRALSAGRHREALAAAARSRRPTPYLRYVCGAARWSLRELRGARAEYEAGLALQPEPQLESSLTRQLEELERELGPHEHAAAVARRNGWLAALVGVLAALLTGLIWRAR